MTTVASILRHKRIGEMKRKTFRDGGNSSIVSMIEMEVARLSCLPYPFLSAGIGRQRNSSLLFWLICVGGSPGQISHPKMSQAANLHNFAPNCSIAASACSVIRFITKAGSHVFHCYFRRNESVRNEHEYR